MKKISPNRNKMIYLAGPYTHKSKKKMIERFKLLTRVSAELVEYGIANFSPITQSHLQAQYGNVGTKWEYWKNIDSAIVLHCDEIWVCKLPGWEESVGVSAELDLARKHKIPIVYISVYTNQNRTHLIRKITNE